MNILDKIGDTPLIEIKKLFKSRDVHIFAKCEQFNPSGSIKDRIAFYMIQEAIRTGKVTKDTTFIEASSGNTGISLAMVCAVLGYHCTIVMPNCSTTERVKMIKAYGANVILIDGSLDDCIKHVEKMISDPFYKYNNEFYHLNQYDNINNAKAQEITGFEIATAVSVDYLISAIGTTGTIMGCARMLKRFNRDMQVIGVTHHMSDKIPGLKNMTYQRVPKIYDKNMIDEIKYVSSSNAKQIVRELAQKEGLFVGISSGAAMYIALKYAKTIKKGNIIVILPDNGNRYLTTDVFNC